MVCLALTCLKKFCICGKNNFDVVGTNGKKLGVPLAWCNTVKWLKNKEVYAFTDVIDKNAQKWWREQHGYHAIYNEVIIKYLIFAIRIWLIRILTKNHSF